MGYHLAGFEVVGVDINPQPNYPFQFIQADALDYLESFGFGFDAIHASPPCQGYSSMTKLTSRRTHPRLISRLHDIFKSPMFDDIPHVIENVPAAKRHLWYPLMLCGTMFGLQVVRHRYFEVFFVGPEEVTLKCNHTGPLYTVLTKSCRVLNDMRGPSSHELGKTAMGIDWMTQKELGEAIPPAYTEYIGKQLRARLNQNQWQTQLTTNPRLAQSAGVNK